jgi:hypothetical protein
MADNRFIPTSLTAKNKPSWPARQLRKLISRIDPELYEQGQNFTFDIYGIRKAVGGKFGEFGNDSNPMAIYRPGNGTGIDSAKAMANNRGFVYASVNAIGREIMNIDWRLFEVSGDDHKEKTEHDLLDLLDGVNPDMTEGKRPDEIITICCATLQHFRFWCIQGNRSRRGFSSRKAALP